MRCRHFSLSRTKTEPKIKKKNQRRNETEYKEPKIKRNLISFCVRNKRKKGNPRFLLWSRFNHFGYSSCISVLFLSLRSSTQLSSSHLQLPDPVFNPVPVSVAVPVSSLQSSASSHQSQPLASERLLAFVAVLFNKFYGLSCVKWKWEFMCL